MLCGVLPDSRQTRRRHNRVAEEEEEEEEGGEGGMYQQDSGQRPVYGADTRRVLLLALTEMTLSSSLSILKEDGIEDALCRAATVAREDKAVHAQDECGPAFAAILRNV